MGDSMNGREWMNIHLWIKKYDEPQRGELGMLV